MSTKYKQYVNARERFFCNSYDLGPDMTGIPAITWISRKIAYKKELPFRFVLVESLDNLERYDLSNSTTVKIKTNIARTNNDLPIRRPLCWQQVELFVEKNIAVLLDTWNDRFFSMGYAGYSEYDCLREALK